MAKSERAFTLIELLLYVAIFAMVAGFFTSILLVTLRVQGTQSGVIEVSTQLNFAMQAIQRNIREATTIVAPASGASASTLQVSGGPTGAVSVTLGTCGAPAISNAICITDAGGTNPITTGKITVTTLTFSHYTTPSTLPCPGTPCIPSTETIQISVTASNNTTSEEQRITRTIQGSASPFNQ